MVRRARCGPYYVKILQARVEKRSNRSDVPDWGDPTDGKAGLRPDQGRVCLAQCLACAACCLGWVHLIAPCGDEQDGCAAGVAAKYDGFRNLVDVAADRCRCISGGAGQWSFDDLCVDPGAVQCGAHAFQAFAHGADRAARAAWVQGALTPPCASLDDGCMNLSDHIIRVPRPFHPERGQEAVDALPSLSGPVRDLIRGAAACSPYLAGLIAQESAWLPAALEDTDAALGAVLTPPEGDMEAQKPALRRAKRRGGAVGGLGRSGGRVVAGTGDGRVDGSGRYGISICPDICPCSSGAAWQVAQP